SMASVLTMAIVNGQRTLGWRTRTEGNQRSPSDEAHQRVRVSRVPWARFSAAIARSDGAKFDDRTGIQKSVLKLLVLALGDVILPDLRAQTRELLLRFKRIG